MIFKRRVLVPADNGVPSDLPPWARDELVRRRLECSDLKSEVIRLRVELARARGESWAVQLGEILSESPRSKEIAVRTATPRNRRSAPWPR